jgi:capsular polysaccharide biosynthesis protein
MSQQALDLRTSSQIVRRHKILVGLIVSLGILGAGAYGVLKPPLVSSTALVALLPASSGAAQPEATAGATDSFTATQQVVADSYPVLLGALPAIHPATSLDALRRNVDVGSPSSDIISVTASGKNAANAEATANAVASSYIKYVSSPHSAVGRIEARLLQQARNAAGPAPVERTIIYALLGGILGALIGVVVALAVGRNDRRLRMRDEIARSIGIPVLASVPVARPSAASGWTKLFESYKPTAVQSWQLRTALHQLGMRKPGSANSLHPGDGSSSNGADRIPLYDGDNNGCFSLTVLSLSSDPGALALGPQLAAFAAAQQIPTSLIIGPPQDAATTATLRTACTAPLSEVSLRDGLLRVAALGEDYLDIQLNTALAIVVVVVDGRAPQMPDTIRTNATVIGVSAGAATAEQLARAAVVATADGREITGIIVADPDPADQTTGRIPRLGSPARYRQPNRLRGIVTEIRR